MADTSDIKKDVFIKWNDAICRIVEFQHINPGKGSAFVRTRFKNVQTGKVLEQTFKVGEKIDVVELDRTNMQFLYKDQSGYAFMDNSNYEQVTVPTEMVGDDGQYLKEGTEVQVLMYEGNPLAITLPKKMSFKVTEAMETVRGDSSGGRVTKEVTLETGMKVQAPLFIKEGEVLIINTETGEYVERA